MNRRMMGAAVFGIFGTAVFLVLGTWQLQRLEWKTALLEGIETRLAMAPVAIPQNPDPVADKYLQVEISGVIAGEELHVLTFGESGPGFRVISAMTLDDGRRILVDRGYVRESAKNAPRSGGEVQATGSLIWPQETDKYIPAPEVETNTWFARDVPLMARTLNTEQIMVDILDSSLNEGVAPQTVSINIHNRHLEYVLTWYGFAAIWFGMTAYLIWRIKQKTL